MSNPTAKDGGHGADVHVPSDTEHFDKVVEMKKQEDEIERGMKELQGQVSIETARCMQSAAFYLANEENGLGPSALLRQMYAQQQFDHANVIALGKLVGEKLGITNKQILSETLKIVGENLFDLQRHFGVIITPEGVTVDQSQNGGESGDNKSSA